MQPPSFAQAGSREQDAGEQLAMLATALDSAMRRGRAGEALEPERLRLSLRPLVGLLLADPDTLPWLLATGSRPALLHRRALGCALLMGVFARHLGFGRRMVEDLMLGALLMDIGKVSVPIGILAKPGKLTPIEMGYVYRHVQRGYALAKLSGDVPPALAAILTGHHERLDGSGYPQGLAGTAIPLAARLAAIVDTYDAMTLDRGYAQGQAPAEALRALQPLRGTALDAHLVEEFLCALGPWPTGSWLRLAGGELAVVREQLPGEPLRPAIIIASTPAGEPLPMAAPSRQLKAGEAVAATLSPAEVRGSAARLHELFACHD
jgi:hypothetical protein